MASANNAGMTRESVERDFRKHPDGVDNANLAGLRQRWQIGERVRFTESVLSWNDADVQPGMFGTVESIDFRYHGGCGYFPMIWVLIDGDLDGPCEFDEKDLEHVA